MTKLKNVKCRECGNIIGKDTKVSSIAKCFYCDSGKKKGKIAAFSRIRHGSAKDLPKKYHKYVMRSGWERNFARILVRQKRPFEYESANCKFFFDGYKRGPRGYLIDFYLPKEDIYFEVKGRFFSRDVSKMKRLAKQYPEIIPKMNVVLSKRNKAATKFYQGMNIPLFYIEDLEAKWKHKIEAWE